MSTALLLCGCLTACSAGDEPPDGAEPTTTETGLTDECGNIFTPVVASAAEEITGSTEAVAYKVLTPAEIAEKLIHEAYGPEQIYEVGGYDLCQIWPSASSFFESLTISHSTARQFELEDVDLPDGSLVFPIGRRAYATSETAVIYFDCVIPSAGGRSTTVTTVASRMGLHPEPGQESTVMRLAHAAAFDLAGEMGCEDDGGLTEEPDLRPVE
ncbi:hypothetical protein ACL02R_15395 [Streptomyces sp. MS19]|uniref:hypothetical protein n=1 Tax=Streptomyces sp. MS19 TaxID=3385972 RepID=UPI0039A09A69